MPRENQARSPFVLGSAAGLLAGLASILANLRQGEPHLVSFLPDLVVAILVGGVVLAAVWWSAATVQEKRRRRTAGEITIVAAGACGLVMGLFTWLYLPSRPVVLAVVAATNAALFVCAIGLIAALTGPRLEAGINLLWHSRSS